MLKYSRYFIYIMSHFCLNLLSPQQIWSYTLDKSSKRAALELLGELEHDIEVTSLDFHIHFESGEITVASGTKDGNI